MDTTTYPSDAAPKARKPRKPKAGEVVANADGSDMEDQRREVIESRVAGLIRDAIMARESSGIEEIWRQDEDQYNGVDPADPQHAGVVKTRATVVATRQALSGTRARLFLNITEPKTDTAVARVQEMLVPHDEKPWDIAPTPVPDLDEAIESGDQSPVVLGDGQQVPRVQAAEALKAKAAEACKSFGDWIEDRFVEGSVYAEMREVIQDAGRLGTGVLKGPFPIEKKDTKWSIADGVSQLVKTIRVAPTSKRVRPQDCFPAPDCGDSIHDGSYFVERDYITARKLRDLAGLPGYDRDAIAKGLREGPMLGMRARDSNRTVMQGESINDAMLFEVYYVYLELPPEDLIELGIDRGRDVDEAGPTLDDTELQLLSVSAMCTMLNGRAIKVSLNPMETGCFPYDFFRWKVIKDQPWGRGVPNKMGVAQRGINAAVRALMENGGMSAGPQIVARRGAVEPADGNYAIVGRKLWFFTPTSETGDDVNKAFAIFNIPSMQEELMAITKFWLEMADILTNLPMLLQGIAQAGTSPETLGGMKMLLDNATAPLRVIAKQYDDMLVGPHLRRYYDYGMQDPSVPNEAKGDAEIKAKGSTVLVQRAEARELLQMLMPVKDDPSFRLNPAKLISEFAKSQGYNLASVQYTDDEWKAEEEKRAQQPAPQDPRIEAANIRNEGLMAVQEARAKSEEAERQWKASEAEMERGLREFESQIDLAIAESRLQGDKEMALDNVKARLADSAMKLRSRANEMQLKLTPSNQSGTGI